MTAFLLGIAAEAAGESTGKLAGGEAVVVVATTTA